MEPPTTGATPNRDVSRLPLDEVRRELDHLALHRFHGRLTPDERRRYEALCRRELEILGKQAS